MESGDDKGVGWTWAIWLSTSGRCSALSSTCSKPPDRQSFNSIRITLERERQSVSLSTCSRAVDRQSFQWIWIILQREQQCVSLRTHRERQSQHLLEGGRASVL